MVTGNEISRNMRRETSHRNVMMDTNSFMPQFLNSIRDRMSRVLFVLCILGNFVLAKCVFFQWPRLQTIDGHLYITGAKNKNITLSTSIGGYLNINGENLAKVVEDAKRAASIIVTFQGGMLSRVEKDFEQIVTQMELIHQRLNVCEIALGKVNTRPSTANFPWRYRRKIMNLERKVREIIRNLTKNECQNDPCQNGGTCFDRYLGFECRCAEGWEGNRCEKDVNECASFAGTDLGCQNGATCINTPGSYRCNCNVGWYGLHCTRRSNDCSSGPPSELCGHGTCVTLTSGSKGFKCICDQGWETDGVNPACTVDVDECVKSPCSRNPPVICHNAPGTFFCGSCPPGYTGNGYACSDVNECLVQNGGCSVQPFVTCINTEGSSNCGPCPPGYAGDGRVCTFVGRCNVDNGGCHPSARCLEIGANVQCQCLPGYTGIGIGPFGCQTSGGGSPVSANPCLPNPCRNFGACFSSSPNNFTCSCLPGFSGRLCNILRNPCTSNPCQNGGTCFQRGRLYSCRCTSQFIGRRCQIEKLSCGGFLRTDEGTLQFPSSNSSSTRYGHNLSCAWVITVNYTRVINVTFQYFSLESGEECQHDWLQIHDGRTASDHMIGKYCGDRLPRNGSIVSSTNSLYMWFQSDHSRSSGGFRLSWNATVPTCGGQVDASIHGTIKSPGSPGKYPPDRDCYWEVEAPPGKRIKFTFFEIALETHENCSYDYLTIHESLTSDSPVLAKYCSTVTPPPLTTIGNTALVHFHSDQYRSDKGFQIHYNPEPGHPGCGGIFTAIRGDISPPIQDGAYIKNIDCAWIIRRPNDMRIRLDFQSFSVEEGMRDGMPCIHDFLEVREGDDVTAPLIGRYCGVSTPLPITSEGNVLFVRFVADHSIQRDGFRITYSSVCGSTFTAGSGVISSPGYPISYRSEDYCTYIIEQPPGKAISLQFQDFEVEDAVMSFCHFDYLEIRDGHDVTSPLMGRFCGSRRPSLIVSTKNYLWMKWSTDRDSQFRGFYANYTTIDVSCGGIYSAPSGLIKSPTQDQEYPPNSRCEWVITRNPGEAIQLTFSQFKLEQHPDCTFDYVAVYDNSSSFKNGGLMGKFCGEQIPYELTSTENLMTVIFKSDATVHGEGFSATYSTFNVSEVCGGNYYTDTGVIKSPGYPQPYPNSKVCTWIIRVSYGRKITLNVNEFSLEGTYSRSTDCIHDFLEVRDGSLETSPLIGRYCGREIPKRITSQSNILFLRLTTDFGRRDKGFYITWDGTLKGCGGALTGFSGSIMSPNYPQPYGINSDCYYRIAVSQGSRIQLSFLDLELEDSGDCGVDYIEVYDGADRFSKLIGRYCSANNHPPIVISTANQMFLRFRSDMSISGKGFHLKYRAVCTTELTGYRGVIESPNFPQSYPESVGCVWTITAPMGNKINVSFSDFIFENACDTDYIEVTEGRKEGRVSNTIGKYCQDNKPTTISSSLESLRVQLVSAAHFPRGNFRMEWIVNGCGGSFVRPRGQFTSPNYPNLYPPSTLCEWFITVDPSSSIRLVIRDISFEKNEECFSDSLEVYGGPDDTSPLLTKLCHSQGDAAQVESSGNQMFVRFKSDSSNEGKGFTASYMTTPAKCGGLQISNYGSIHSRNYPKNYDANDDCHWVIRVDKFHRVNLTFIDFDMVSDENCTDGYVEVSDGTNTLMRHCGNTLPAMKTILSLTNVLTVRMKSAGGRFSAKGFLANFTIACGATITADEPGVITLGNHVNVVETNYNCSWTIISPEPDGHVALTLTTMEISRRNVQNDTCNDAKIVVYDGSDENAAVRGIYCSTITPLPIISQGNVLLLKLVAHWTHQGYFSAAYSSSSSACGGSIGSESGSFASPMYPESYPPNSECIWELQSSPGNQIELNFKEFDIASSDLCNEDYVEIRNENSVGKLIGVYCGQSSPNNVIANSSLWVKFKSSKDGSGRKGFLADFSLVFGNDLTGTSGQIGNPMYPRPFVHFVRRNSPITWRITVSFGKLVKITFKELHIDQIQPPLCTNGVAVYDGFDNTAPQLKLACGVSKPDDITSSSNVMFVTFTNSPHRYGALFLLEWSEVAKPYESWLNYPTISPIPGCGGTIDLTGINTTSAQVTSPGYPNGYGQNVNCTWIIESTQEHHLSLIVNTMDLYQSQLCFQEYVSISKGTESGEWKELGKVCRHNETNLYFSGNNLMKINFISHWSYNQSGFSVTVNKECGGSIKKSNGVIVFNWDNAPQVPASREASNWYRNGGSCEWDITVSPGRTIKATFTHFNIQSLPDGTCQDKFVVLRNGGTSDSPFLGRGTFCTQPNDIPETTSNKLFVKIKTAYSTSSFTLKYEEISHSCGGRFLLTDDYNSTIVSSPNYPNIPPPNIECIWTFVSSHNQPLQIDFLDRFDLTYSFSCDSERVEIRDGGTALSEELGRFCTEKPDSVKTTGNMLYVKYFSNVTDPKNGFKARVSFARCGGILRNFYGVLTSPGYPNSYPYETLCKWDIEADLWHRVLVDVLDVDLPRSRQPFVASMFTTPRPFQTRFRAPPHTPFDRTRFIPFRPRISNNEPNFQNCSTSGSIMISEPAPPEPPGTAPPEMNPILYRYLLNLFRMRKTENILSLICTNEKPSPVTSTGNKISITFKAGKESDVFQQRTNKRGFKLRVAPVEGGCYYYLSTASGVITSPKYPNAVPEYNYCTWKITVPEGRRVTLTVEDFDLAGSFVEQRLSFFNDHKYQSLITVLSKSSTIADKYQSTSNKMLIVYWSNTFSGSGHRGFKMRYNSEEPAACGGNIDDESGVIASPKNVSSFVCEWQFKDRTDTNQTMAFTVTDSVIGNRTGECSSRYSATVSIASKDTTSFQADICGNVSSLTVRSPFTNLQVTAVQGSWFGTVNFTMRYKLSQCGGHIFGPEAIITSPGYPGNYPPDMDCAWIVEFAYGQTIKLTFLEFDLEPSCSDFFSIKNGVWHESPLIGEYCSATIPSPSTIVSEGYALFLEFHSDSMNQRKGFKVKIEPATSVCGGVIHSEDYELMTPNFPSQYGNNQECEWELRSSEGTHIGLVFLDRFHLETSDNCGNDFVKVFDYVKGDWKLIKTFCGREVPSPVNSTSTRMKVLFRSNGAVTGDGFKARWYQNCGGTFWSVSRGRIVSPNYPGNYPGNLHCIYYIDYGNANIYLNFSYFQLDTNYKGECRYDRLELFESQWSGFQSIGTFCGTTIPRGRNVRSKVKIEFKTDSYTHGKGFVLDFASEGCGGYINESQVIEYRKSSIDLQQFPWPDCIWNIEAPGDMTVIIRFKNLNLPHYYGCETSSLEGYNGLYANGTLLGKICGYHEHPPALQSSTGKMSLRLRVGWDLTYANYNFTAFVLFSYGPAQGCGGNVVLGSNPETIVSPDANRDLLYEEYLDCAWTIKAQPFHYIIANFVSLDVDNCNSPASGNSTTGCPCDYVELRDGPDQVSDLLVKTCGATAPASSVVSSGNAMMLHFATDGAYNRKGFNIQFSSQISQCGYGILRANDSVLTLRSPNYPRNYPLGIRCRWVILSDDTVRTWNFKKLIHVHIDDWDLTDSEDCSNDYFSIEDTGASGTAVDVGGGLFSKNGSLDGALIIRGESKNTYFEKRTPRGESKFCGTGKSLDFYSASNEITVQFVSTSGISKKGFQLEYSVAGCTRNYTGEQGRIRNVLFRNDSHCYMTITAPSSNHTISLYFSIFTMRGGEDCSRAYLEVRDGPGVESPLLGKFCGYSRPSPVFSAGQNLWLHVYTQYDGNVDYHSLDITYTTTDKGSGCGGRFFATGGTFTSPKYPSNVRATSVCRWDVSVPTGLEIVLRFTAFDIGPSSTCETDFIEIFDVNSKMNFETLRSRFCGGNNVFGVIRTSSDSVAVKYTTSLHNGGTGWQMDFMSVTPGTTVT